MRGLGVRTLRFRGLGFESPATPKTWFRSHLERPVAHNNASRVGCCGGCFYPLTGLYGLFNVGVH